jgi:hypothetical protein
MTTIKTQVVKTATGVGDNPESLVCFYRPFLERYEFGPMVRCTVAELPEREFNDGRGGEPFIGFSDRYVYVCVTYDGSEWIEAVPRSPEVVEATGKLPEIGDADDRALVTAARKATL